MNFPLNWGVEACTTAITSPTTPVAWTAGQNTAQGTEQNRSKVRTIWYLNGQPVVNKDKNVDPATKIWFHEDTVAAGAIYISAVSLNGGNPDNCVVYVGGNVN